MTDLDNSSTKFISLGSRTKKEEADKILRQLVAYLKAGGLVILDFANRMYICLVDGKNSRAVDELIALKNDPDKILSHMVLKNEAELIAHYADFFKKLPTELYVQAIWRTTLRDDLPTDKANFYRDARLSSQEGIQISSLEELPFGTDFCTLCSQNEVELVGSSANWHDSPTIVNDLEAQEFGQQIPMRSLIVKVGTALAEAEVETAEQKLPEPRQSQVHGSMNIFRVVGDQKVQVVRKMNDYEAIVKALRETGVEVENS